jgi:hypothetical protein
MITAKYIIGGALLLSGAFGGFGLIKTLREGVTNDAVGIANGDARLGVPGRIAER